MSYRVIELLDLKFDVAISIIPVLVLFNGDNPVAGFIVVIKARCYD